MDPRFRSALAVLVIALTGCVTAPTYGALDTPKSGGYGYRDTLNADGTHTIFVVGATDAMAREFWDRRAAEICGGVDFHKNIFRAERPIVQVSGYASNPSNPAYGGSYTTDAYGGFYLEGYLRCTGHAEAAPNAPAAAQAAPAPPEAPAQSNAGAPQ